jgi:hypothetical protein
MKHAEERRSRRARVVVNATVESQERRIAVRVSNLSAHGALVVGDGLPPNDTPVTFTINGVTVDSWVAWERDCEAGIQFTDALSPERLLRKPPVAPTVIVKDSRVIDCRRPGLRGNQLTAEEKGILALWRQTQHS